MSVSDFVPKTSPRHSSKVATGSVRYLLVFLCLIESQEGGILSSSSNKQSLITIVVNGVKMVEESCEKARLLQST